MRRPILFHSLADPLLVSAAVLAFGHLFVLGAKATPPASEWREILRPPLTHHASALAAGHEWLYASWAVETGTTVGVFRSAFSSPDAWEPLGLPFQPIHDILLIGALDDTVIVAANSETCVYRSFDGGANWEAGDIGLPVESAHALAWMEETDRLVLEGRNLDGDEQRFFSDDLGDSWTPIGPGYVANYKPFLMAPGGANVVYQSVYSGFSTSEVLRSIDNGENWDPLPGEFGTYVHDLDAGSSDPLCVAALMGGAFVPRWCETMPLETWQTPWTAVGVELPAWDPGRAYLVGLDASGRPVSAWRTWSGPDWVDFGQGLPAVSGPGVGNQWLSFHLVAALDEQILFYATKDHGLWSRLVDDPTAEVAFPIGAPASDEPRLEVLPNPARGAVRFRLQEQKPGAEDARAIETARLAEPLTLDIFDAGGRLVRSLRGSASGSTWDGRDGSGRQLPSGVYRVSVRGSRGSTTLVRID